MSRRLLIAAAMAAAMSSSSMAQTPAMKWTLVLYYAALGGPGTATAIGPFDQRDGCIAVGQLATKDGWRGFCYPVGDVPLKKEEAPATKPEKKK